jgi:hypothetical protein
MHVVSRRARVSWLELTCIRPISCVLVFPCLQIVEESPLQLECTVPGASAESATVSHVIVPPLLKLMHVPGSGDIRRQATACLNAIAREMPPGMHDNLDKWVQAGS